MPWKPLLFGFRMLLLVAALSACASAQDGRHPPKTHPPVRGSRPPTAVIRPSRDPSIRLAAVGDIMLAGPMGNLMAKRGRGFPFARMKPFLRSADIVFGNLECCIATIGSKVPKKYNFQADPHMAPALRESGFTIVSLANNHTWDFGREALADTVRTVRATGVRTVGAGANRQEAHQLQVIGCKGKRIGFLAYLGLLPAIVPESETEPCLSMASVQAIRDDVEHARPAVDILIVSIHGGKEGHTTPTPFQKLLARTAIDAGADMVIGHHPHVPQPLVRYRGKYIAYSLGNFVFSTTGRGGGVMLDARISPNNAIRASAIPLSMAGSQPGLRSERPIRIRKRMRPKRFSGKTAATVRPARCLPDSGLAQPTTFVAAIPLDPDGAMPFACRASEAAGSESARLCRYFPISVGVSADNRE